MKRVRVHSKEGPGKVTKVCRRPNHLSTEVDETQTLYQVAVLWKKIEHPNIVPLLGVTPPPLQIISEWVPGGDLMYYSKKYSGVDRLSLVSISPLILNGEFTPS